jgi:anti-sigma-K factor RskA
VRTRAVEEASRLGRKLAELEGTLQKVTTPELELATVKSEKGEVIKILIDPLTGNWYVMAFQLPPAAADQDYQLWFLDKKPGSAPIPSELFRPGQSSALEALIQVPAGVDPAGAAISLEPKGGSPNGKPTQVIVGGLL